MQHDSLAYIVDIKAVPSERVRYLVRVLWLAIQSQGLQETFHIDYRERQGTNYYCTVQLASRVD